jgi:hypothetical protein
MLSSNIFDGAKGVFEGPIGPKQSCIHFAYKSAETMLLKYIIFALIAMAAKYYFCPTMIRIWRVFPSVLSIVLQLRRLKN